MGHVGECSLVHLTLAFCNVHPVLSYHCSRFPFYDFCFTFTGYGHALEAAVIRFANAFISVIVAALHLSLATAFWPSSWPVAS